VCTLPLIAALRPQVSQARLDVLVNSYCAPVLAGNPDIDHLYVLPRPNIAKPASRRWASTGSA
jgi:ADP-heptose:LPS heptosyltransferase